MSTHQVNTLLQKYKKSGCIVQVLQRKSGQWKAYLNRKPDEFTERLLKSMFPNIKMKVSE